MSDRNPSTAEDSLKFGLLMESAQIHQQVAETQLQQLRAHAQGLDGVVRDEIRRTLVEEMKTLFAEVERAIQGFRAMRSALRWRGLAWNAVLAGVLGLAPVALTHWAVPSAAEIDALRAERDTLARNVAQLERRGGKVDWRTCGAAARLCVRIDREAPVFGGTADYYVVKGY
jgi:uncharacterized protein involved in exopolysaccharide biosynthesis